MKQFIAFVRKEFFHIFRDRRTMLILLGMPIMQIILFGFAITTEVKNVRVAVLDPSNDVVTRRIIDRVQILHQMIQRNPTLQLLIDELDLELIE